MYAKIILLYSRGDKFPWLPAFCFVFTLSARKYFLLSVKEKRKVKRSSPHPWLTPGLRRHQSKWSNWRMKGIERHKAIHMLSRPSARYLALIMRCRFYFLLLQNACWVSFCAIMLPHAGPLYHANARSSFAENNTTKREDISAYFSPPVHTERTKQSRSAREKIP